MAVDLKSLTKEWIQFLKNNKIVDLNSDPATGKLSYKRGVTSDDVSKFLEIKTDFSAEEISNAIHMVLAQGTMKNAQPKLDNNPTPKEPSKDISTWSYYGMSPGNKQPVDDTGTGADNQARTPPRQLGNSQPRVSHDPNSISDIDYRDKPEDKSSVTKSKFGRRNVKEEIKDVAGHNLGEKEVEQIFSMLVAPKPAQSASDNNTAVSVDREEQLRKFKRLIRDVMTDAQRKSLWRALHDA